MAIPAVLLFAPAMVIAAADLLLRASGLLRWGRGCSALWWTGYGELPGNHSSIGLFGSLG